GMFTVQQILPKSTLKRVFDPGEREEVDARAGGRAGAERRCPRHGEHAGSERTRPPRRERAGYSQRPTVVPSSNFAAMKLPAADPSRIGCTRTVTLAPALNVEGRTPWRASSFGLPHSMLHSFGVSPGLIAPTTWIQECGL